MLKLIYHVRKKHYGIIYLFIYIMFISLINEITIMLISLLSYEHMHTHTDIYIYIYIYYFKEKILFFILSSTF